MLKKLRGVISVLFFIAGSLVLNSCGNSSTNTEPVDNSLNGIGKTNVPPPQPIIFKVENVYPHDTLAFTQGLQFYKGKLYEGTGSPDEIHKTTLRVVDIKTGKPEKQYFVPDQTIFGEGITIFKNKIYQLTWKNHKVFVYNIDDITHPVDSLKWDQEGWGITNDGENLIISDGSSRLYYVQPNLATKEMRMTKILSVIDNNGEVDSLNELEYINGYVFANRWYNNHIEKIDTSNGHVTGVMDLAGMFSQYDPNDQLDENAVLNGIAYDSTTKNLYITGKDWPKLFEMKLN